MSANLGYDAYIVAVSQFEENAPIANVFKDDFGAEDWVRAGPGSYSCDTRADYVSDKIYIASSTDNNGVGSPGIPVIGGSNIIVGYIIFSISESETGKILLRLASVDLDGLAVDLDTLMNGSSINLPEVRVYPKYL